MSPEGGSPPGLPTPVRETLESFSSHFDLNLRVWRLRIPTPSQPKPTERNSRHSPPSTRTFS